MTNEEIQEIVAKADAEYDRLKDRVHEQYDEIKRLNNIINKAIEYIENNVWSCYILDEEKELLGILKGVDKE